MSGGGKGGGAGRAGEGSEGRTSSFNIKRIYETFSFHFDNQKGRTTAVARGERSRKRGEGTGETDSWTDATSRTSE